jgi:rubrerythrin
MEALETGMQNERNAHEIYLYLAKTNPEHRKLFKYLAMTEMGHYEALKQDYLYFNDEFTEKPSAKLSKVYAAGIFRSLDIEK